MAYKIDEKAAISAYNRLSEEQKERFFPGQEEEAKKIVGSLSYLLGSNCKYEQLLDLFITAAVRVMMGFENERVNITVKMRFSDIVPQEKALTVIECIRRIVNNHSYIDGLNSPEMKAHSRYFDSQNEVSFKENEKRLEDAVKNPGFGTNMENPIFAHSADGSYSYLNLLCTSAGVPLTWNRIGSISPRSSRDPLDKYELLLPDGEVYLIVYVNMYSRKRSAYCPAGLMGKGLQTVPDYGNENDIDDEDDEYNEPEDEEELTEEDEFQAFLRAYSKDNSTPKEEKPKKQKQTSSDKEEKKPAPASDTKTHQKEQKIEQVSESNMRILQGNLPVVLEKCTITKKINGELYAVCTFRSLTDRSIRAMMVDILCNDVWKQSVQPVNGVQYNDLKTKRNDTFGSHKMIPLPDPNTRSINIVVQKIMLEDGTLLQRTEENLLIPELTPIENDIGRELGNEYRKLTYNDAKYVPIQIGSYWRCSCGGMNSNGEADCHFCKKDKTVLFSYWDKEDLKESLEERKRQEKEKEEKERIAREEERRAREQKEAEEAQARAEKKRKRNRGLAVSTVVVIAAALAVYFVVWQIIPSNNYKKAEDLLKQGDREAAYSAFLELGKFKDSADRAYDIKYEDGKAALEAKDYDKAFELFSGISGYRDGETQAKEAIYQKAASLIEAKAYLEAAGLLKTIPGYKDSEEQEAFCRNEQSYLDATKLLEKAQYKEAGETFEAIESYRDSTALMTQAYYLYAKALIEQEKPHDAYLVLSEKVNRGDNGYEDSIDLANTIEYQYASDCFAEKKYADAAESFANLKDYQDSETRCKESQYQQGLEMINNGLYDSAEKLFAELGDYKDSAAQINESVYRHGVALLESEKYDDAIEILGQLTNYRDSATKYNEARYQKGLQLLNKKEFEDAEKIFADLGYYRDSQTQLCESKYQRAKSLVKEKKFQVAVHLFKELGYYNDSVEQWKSAMYSYVLANKNNNDSVTYDYLILLRQYNYKDSGSIYENLYKWEATIKSFNTSRTDNSTISRTVSKTAAYLHAEFKLSGGPPGEKVTLTHRVYWPDGNVSYSSWYWNDKRRGSNFGVEWSDGLYQNSNYAKAGNLIIRVYISATGEQIGEASIKLT